MSTLFRVESTDIRNLNDLQLTRLLKLLLQLEARRFGISERSVEVALNIYVADGGEDGRIKWRGEPQSTDFLPSNFVQFQCKAITNLGPTACAKELISKDGSMKKMVEEALDNGAAYILFKTQELNKEQRNRRIKAIRRKLKELNKTYAETAIINIYDASIIESWVNKHLVAVVTVLKWIGRPWSIGLKTWEDWGQNPDYHKFQFITDEHRKIAMESLRSHIKNNRNCARIIGLSGIGKTRLAYETFRDLNESSDYSKRVVYVDTRACSGIVGLLSDWIQCDLEGILVVDNCDISLHDSLMREVKRVDSKFSLLTLDYNPERAIPTEIIRLKQLSGECIKQMLEPVYGKEISDIDRIVDFAQGFPQMAVLLANARLDKETDMGRLTDDDLANKLLWGGRVPSKEDEQILRGCSLFDRFGLEGEASHEFEFIASVVGVNLDNFYDCVKRFEERGLIDRRGRFASLVPKPLAIRLAAEWWTRTRSDKQTELIQADMPGSLIDSFCNQISRLDFLPEVKTLTEKLCGSQAPFGQAEVILSNKGSRLFRALAEVNPEATSIALYNILEKCDEDKFLKIEGDVRRNLVWALEKLCFHAHCFEKAANSLLLLASYENEEWSNNATGIFVQLFRIFLSGTEAPPSMRLRLIESALESNQIKERKLGVLALEKAISTYSGHRRIGAEYQGSGEPLQEWRPKIWGEAFEYWDQSLNMLCELVIKKDPLSQMAKEAISKNMRGLIAHGRVESLDNIIQKIVDKDGPVWTDALNSIKLSLRYDSERMPDKGKIKIQEWISLLTPKALVDRLELLIINPPYEHEKQEDGHYEDIAAKNAKLLAEELADKIDSLLPFVDNLLVGNQKQAYIFGKSLVESSGKWDSILIHLINKIENIENPNINFLLGILNGIFNINKVEWNKIVDIFYKKAQLNKYYAHVLVTGDVTDEQLYSLLNLIKQNKIKPNSVYVFSWGSPLDHLSDKSVLNFVTKLSNISETSSWIALEILSMYFYGKNEKWDYCKPVFKDIVIKSRLDQKAESQTQLEMHHWQEITERILMDGDEEFAISITQQILSSCTEALDYGDLCNYIKPIIRIIFQKYAKNVWPIFAQLIENSNPLARYEIVNLLRAEDIFERNMYSILSDVPEEIIDEWCLKNPKKVPEFVAEATEVLVDSGDKYKISSRAKFLLDNFGENEKVLSALSVNLSSFGWSGSLVPYLKKEVAALEEIKNHKFNNVRKWVNKRLDYLNKLIRKENIKDEEHDWGIY